MHGYVAGIDGGGTKTHFALFDTSGSFVDFVQWGATNHENLKGGFDEFKIVIGKLLDHVLEKNKIGLDDIRFFVLGMAGVDTKAQHKTLSGILHDIGIRNFILCNDSYLGIKAGSAEGYGICVINGTGCSVTGLDPNGRMFQIGGQGDLTADAGGGGELGVAVVRLVYNQLFRFGQTTLLTDLLFTELGIKSKYDFMEIISEQLASGMKPGDFCRFLFRAADMGDSVSIELLEQVGRELGISVTAAIEELGMDRDIKLPVILAGSVITKNRNPALVESLKQEVVSRNRDREMEFITLDKPPVAGAVVWALESISKNDGLGGKEEIYKVVAEEFRKKIES